ncbi:MAG: hypothetical protein CMJ87_11985 [Planctomycetes bacterium]|jgi:hypothetical protein|nr:hypothetical protein [Planctomycetota bacterium]
MKKIHFATLALLLLGQSCTSTGGASTGGKGARHLTSTHLGKVTAMRANKEQAATWRAEIAAAEAARVAEAMRPQLEREAARDAAEAEERLANAKRMRRERRDVFWDRFERGQMVLGVGGSLYSNSSGAVHMSGFDGGGGAVTGELAPGDVSRLGGGLSLDYFLSNQAFIRGSYEYRRQDPEVEYFSGGELDFDGAGVSEISVGVRYMPNVFLNRRSHQDDRLRMFVGADISYVPEYLIEGRLDSGTSIRIDDGDLWLGSLSVGAFTPLGDNLVFEFGVEYEAALSDAVGTATITDGIAPPWSLDTETDSDGMQAFFRIGMFL